MDNTHNRYAIVVEMEGLLEESAKAAWQMLEIRYGINFISSNTAGPHITLDSGFCGEVQSIESVLNELSSCLKNCKVNGNGLGVFLTDTPVVYIRWLLTKEFYELTTQVSNALLDLQKSELIQEFVPNYNWVAKSTLAYKDINLRQLSSILKELECYNFNAPMLINNLCLYEYNPFGKEKRLLHFSI